MGGRELKLLMSLEGSSLSHSLEVLLCSANMTTHLCISIHFRFLSVMFTRSFPAVSGL